MAAEAEPEDARPAKRSRLGKQAPVKQEPQGDGGASTSHPPPKASARPKKQSQKRADEASNSLNDFARVMRQIIAASEATVASARQAQQLASQALNTARAAIEEHARAEQGRDPDLEDAVAETQPRAIGDMNEVFLGLALRTEEGYKKAQLGQRFNGRVVLWTDDEARKKETQNGLWQAAWDDIKRQEGLDELPAKGSDEYRAFMAKVKEAYNKSNRCDASTSGPAAPSAAR